MIPDWFQAITEVASGLAGALFLPLAPHALSELGIASNVQWKYASAAMSV